MTDIFSLDVAGNAALAAEAAANPIAPADVQPGMFAGTAHSMAAGVFRGGVQVARALELAGSVPVGIAEPFLGKKQGELTDAYFAAVDPSLRDAVDYWTPDANETGSAARVLGGLSEAALPLLLGGGNPIPLLGTVGLTGSMQASDQGAGPDTAAAVGTIAAGANALGFKVPFLGNSLLTRVGSGAAGNLAIGAGSAEANRLVLKATGNDAAAQQYDPFDMTGRGVDLLMGVAFGGLAHMGSHVTASERDAALAALNNKHLIEDTAPGKPADLSAAMAHQEAIDQSINAILRGEPVVAPADVTSATFEPRPAEPAPELPKDLAELDANRAAAPAGLASDLVPHADLATVDLTGAPSPDATRAGMTEMYTKAAQVKPAFDQAVNEIAQEIGTPHKPKIPETLKGVKRAAKKIIGDYEGEASNIKDLVRGTIVVDTPEQAAAAVAAILRRFGNAKGEIPKLRDTLNPDVVSPDGYRDINTNVVVNGHVSELQINYPEMIKAKDENHGLYEERDALLREGKARGGLTPEEDARVAQLDATMKERYDAAWNEVSSRLKSASETAVPSEYASESGKSLPSGTSNARAEVPPLGLEPGMAATGIPPTSQKMGSLPNTGAVTKSPPTASIVRPAGGKSESSKNQAPAQAVMTAAREIAARPDFKVATGEFDAEGNPVVASAADVLARGDAEIAQAQREAKGIEAAVTCFLERGVS